MNRKILFVFIIVLAMIGTYCVKNKEINSNLSLLTLANIEALARYEFPDVEITCDTGGSGQCYYVAVEEGLWGTCRFDCEFSGDSTSSCSSCWVNIANFCSAFAAACGG